MKEKVMIYQHRRVDNNEIFYVGIGLESRPYDTNSRNKHWHSIVKKYGYSVEILNEVDNWRDAVLIEINLISKYGRRDLGTGSLVNLTNGGEGSLGRVTKPETREKLSKLSKGRKDSKDTLIKKRISHLGKKRTYDQRMGFRKAQLVNAKIVQQYDMNGIFLSEYCSIAEAARQTNSISNGITRCCSGHRNNHNGFIWKYKQ